MRQRDTDIPSGEQIRALSHGEIDAVGGGAIGITDVADGARALVDTVAFAAGILIRATAMGLRPPC
jgi:hypothetical protein